MRKQKHSKQKKVLLKNPKLQSVADFGRDDNCLAFVGIISNQTTDLELSRENKSVAIRYFLNWKALRKVCLTNCRYAHIIYSNDDISRVKLFLASVPTFKYLTMR